MASELTRRELEFLLKSATESKRAFENYDRYPNEDFRKQQVSEAEEIISKLKSLIKDMD